MIRRIPFAKIPLINIVYCVTIGLLLSIILWFLIRIQSQYGSELINLRFNVWEGVSIIDSSQYVWQYGIYALSIAIMNGIAILYTQKRFTNPSIQAIIGYWILGISILALMLFICYLSLVLIIN